uniref:GTP-binding signal recognition particle SRP54, G-domain n=1 Tax=Medicago truncatula TaxID=3880 RepID=A2Q5P1_MEDTR|nr:GTP-binding signal recognition particle SRP54, G-domain [Medicago truncatula]
MGLADLGGRILRGFDKMSNETVIDKEIRKRCVNEITRAFIQSIIEPKLIRDMHAKIKNIIYNHLNLDDFDAARKMIQQVPSCCGKTTTCAQFANHYQKKGLKTGLVCTDTLRNGAFDQLKQIYAETNIPCYGRVGYCQNCRERCGQMQGGNCDLIIVDVSGGHKQEEDALIEEIHQVSKATKPDLVILVIDGNIGQHAFDHRSLKQATAFTQSVDIGAVIVSKMDGYAMGGGSLSAVAATKSSVIFIGTGEHMDEFEVFEVKPFVSSLLGMDDWYEFIDRVYEVPELPLNLPERKIWMPPRAFFPPSLHHLFDD